MNELVKEANSKDRQAHKNSTRTSFGPSSVTRPTEIAPEARQLNKHCVEDHRELSMDSQRSVLTEYGCFDTN